LRKSAVFTNKLQEPLASQVFNQAAELAAAAENAHNLQSPESPNEATLTIPAAGSRQPSASASPLNYI